MTFFPEVKSLPHQFPHGLRVLVVDHDTTMLSSITEMCVRCKYQVTTCCNASFALNLLKETKNLYDVILIEAQMPDMDSNNFLQQQIKIPVIMMSVDQSTSPSLVRKAVEKGACGYWIKPLSEGQIKNMWQHVVRKVLKENNQNDHVLETLNAKGLKKRERDDYCAPTYCIVGKENDDNVNNYQPSTKKSRLSWSQELHQQFLWAVNQLGIHDAKPRKIIKLMNVAGLTTKQVASHLQKLRATEETDVKIKKPKVGKKKSKVDGLDSQALTTDIAVQNNVANEAISSLEVVNSMPISSIECDNVSCAQPLTTDDTAVQNNVANETISSLEVVNSMPISSIECDNISNAQPLTTDDTAVQNNVPNESSTSLEVEDYDVFFTELDDIISLYEACSPSEFDVFN